MKWIIYLILVFFSIVHSNDLIDEPVVFTNDSSVIGPKQMIFEDMKFHNTPYISIRNKSTLKLDSVNLCFKISTKNEIIFLIEKNSTLIMKNITLLSNYSFETNFIISDGAVYISFMNICSFIIKNIEFFIKTNGILNISDFYLFNNTIESTFLWSDNSNISINNCIIFNNYVTKMFIYYVISKNLYDFVIIYENMLSVNNYFYQFFYYECKNSVRNYLLNKNIIYENNFFEDDCFKINNNEYSDFSFTLQNMFILNNKIKGISISIKTDTNEFSNLILNNYGVYNNDFKNNNLLNGFIYLKGNINTNISNGFIINNQCSNIFCGIFLDNSETTDSHLMSYTILDGVKFINNTVFILSLNSNIVGNCLIINKFCSFHINNSQFIKNSLSNMHGNPCIYSNQPLSGLTIKNSLFTQNLGFSESNCIYFKGFSLKINDCFFYENKLIKHYLTTNSFGTLFFDVSYAELNNLTFINNIGSSGAIFSSSSSIEKNFIFADLINGTNNIADNNQIYFDLQNFLIIIKNSYFTDNYSKGTLLFIYNSFEDINEHLMNVTNSIFSNNSAELQSGVFSALTIALYINFSDCSFINNKLIGKKGYSGVIFQNSEITGTIILFNCIFIKNFAFRVSSINNLCGTVIAINTIFEENIATDICLFITETYSEFYMTNLIIKNNICNNNAIIKALGRSVIELKNSSFENNEIIFGSGIVSVFLLAKVTISFCYFSENKGNTDGLILYIMNTYFPVVMNENIISYNKGNGSLFYINSGNLILENNIIKNNEGQIFFIFLSFLESNKLFIFHQNCFNKYSNCIMSTLSKSNITLISFNINYINSFSENPLILIKLSTIILIESVFENIFTLKKTNLFQIMNSNFESQLTFAKKFDLNIYYFLQSNINILQNYIFSNNSVITNCITVISSDNLNISNSLFFFFSEKNGASLKIIESNGIISNCSFYNNIADEGGAIYVLDSNIYIGLSIFINNTASFGGSIYFDSNSEIKNFNISFFHNNFSNSNAHYAGGAFFWKKNKPNFENTNIYLNNSAITGKDYSSEPIMLFLENNNDHESEILSNLLMNYIPGYSIQISLIFKLKDFYEQIINYHIEGEAILDYFYLKDYKIINFLNEINNTQASIFGKKITSFEANKFIFGNISINTNRNQPIFISISTNLIKGFKNYDYKYPNFYRIKEKYYYLLFFNVTDCPIGYLWKEDERKCEKCKSGFYSFNKDDEICFDCPEHSICDTNGSFINVLSGYWRSGYFSSNIYKCYINEACIGEDSCAEGYEGPLCNTCAISNSEKFYKNSSNKCESCNKAAASYAIFGISIFFIIIYLVYNIKINIKEFETKRSIDLSQIKSFSSVTVIFKMITDYLQICGYILGTPIDFPNYFEDTFNVLFKVTDLITIFYPIDCILGFIGPVTFSIFYKKIIVLSILGIIMPLLSIVYWFGYGLVKKLDLPLKIQKIIITIVVICYSLQPNYINIYFMYQNCIEIDGHLYVKKFLKEECWIGDHLFYYFFVIIPCLSLWMIILPYIMFNGLRKSSKTSNRRLSLYQKKTVVNLKRVYQFIKDGYDNQFYFWEFVLLSRKYLIIFISVFQISNHFALNIIVLNIIITFYFILQVKYQPFINDKLNYLCNFSNFCIQLNCFLLFFLLYAQIDYYKFFSVIPILCVNLIFLGYFILVFIRIKKKQIMTNLNIIKKKIVNDSKKFFNSLNIRTKIYTRKTNFSDPERKRKLKNNYFS